MKSRDAAILVGIGLLLLSRKSKASSITTSPGEREPIAPSPPVANSDFAKLWQERVDALMKRARTGAKWAPRMSRLLGSDAAGAAAGRWIGIESGGNPRAQSSMTERGLAQVSHGSLKEFGLTEGDFAAMVNPNTSDDDHAKLAAMVIRGEMLRATKADADIAPSPFWGPAIALAPGRFSLSGIGIAKMRHSLPLLLKEMNAQGLIRASISDSVAEAIRKPFAPSPRLASFAKGTHALTGNIPADLLLRFMTSVAVVALAEDAATAVEGLF